MQRCLTAQPGCIQASQPRGLKTSCSLLTISSCTKSPVKCRTGIISGAFRGQPHLGKQGIFVGGNHIGLRFLAQLSVMGKTKRKASSFVEALENIGRPQYSWTLLHSQSFSGLLLPHCTNCVSSQIHPACQPESFRMPFVLIWSYLDLLGSLSHYAGVFWHGWSCMSSAVSSITCKGDTCWSSKAKGSWAWLSSILSAFVAKN